VAGSASIPSGAANYGPAPQGYPSQSGAYGGQSGSGGQYGSAAQSTYGQPAAPSAFGQPAAPTNFGQPPQGAAFGQSHAPAFQSASSGPGQYGQASPGPGGPPPGFNAGGYNQTFQAEPERGREQNWSDEEPSPSSGRGQKRILIIAAIAAVLLVVVGIGGFVGYKLTNRSADYAVGTCVLKDDTSAKVVDCNTGGAYKITSLEDAVSKCPDIFQPSLALPSAPAEHRYACLAPMAAG
jgi:hypothetical protein